MIIKNVVADFIGKKTRIPHGAIISKVKRTKERYSIYHSFDLTQPVGFAYNIRVYGGKLKADIDVCDLEVNLSTCLAPAYSYSMHDEFYKQKVTGELMYFGLVLEHAMKGIKKLKRYVK